MLDSHPKYRASALIKSVRLIYAEELNVSPRRSSQKIKLMIILNSRLSVTALIKSAKIKRRITVSRERLGANLRFDTLTDFSQLEVERCENVFDLTFCH